jgi:dihydrofolate reductase
VRKMFSFLMATLDGYYEGPNREFDFWRLDDDFYQDSVEQLDDADTLVFGRVTYEGMAAYWPTPAAEQDNPRIAARMNGTSKIVVSRTLDQANWANTRVFKAPEDLGSLKREPGQDIAIMGSSDLTVSLIQLGLLDELRIMLNPVVLGAGKSVFRTATERIGLRLLESRPFESGNVLLTYQPSRDGIPARRL